MRAFPSMLPGGARHRISTLKPLIAATFGIWLAARPYKVIGAGIFGQPRNEQPQEALLAALSSCHLLTFLTVAALKRLVVDSYEDEPLAELGKNDKGRMMVSRLILRPRVTFGGETIPDEHTVRELHRKAGENCFIGNSLLSSVVLEPRF